MSVTITGPTHCVLGGRRYYTWTIQETTVDTDTHFEIDVPMFCTLTEYQAVSDQAISPALALASGDQAGTIDQVAVNATAAQFICNRGRVAITAVAGVLYVRSNPAGGSANIQTRITIVEGHC